jgi:hypothetical protein
VSWCSIHTFPKQNSACYGSKRVMVTAKPFDCLQVRIERFSFGVLPNDLIPKEVALLDFNATRQSICFALP